MPKEKVLIIAELTPEEVTIEFVNELDKLKGIWCGTIEEPYVLVKDVRVNTRDINLMGKERQDTWKFQLNEDGIQCTRRIKAISPASRIVLISAYPDREFHRLGLEAGAIAFLDKKDLDLPAIRQVVEDAL